MNTLFKQLFAIVAALLVTTVTFSQAATVQLHTAAAAMPPLA